MTKDKKPTEDQAKKLEEQLNEIEKTTDVMIVYHSKRTGFFKNWDKILNVLDVIFCVGGLTIVMTSSEKILSLGAVCTAIFLLFLNIIFKVSKKAETHRWLATIYSGYKKELSGTKLIAWDNLTEGKYKKHRNLHDRLNEGMNNLKGKEHPILRFLYFLSEVEQRQNSGKSVPIVFNIKWWQNILYNYCSMSDSAIKLFEKFNAEQRQQEQIQIQAQEQVQEQVQQRQQQQLQSLQQQWLQQQRLQQQRLPQLSLGSPFLRSPFLGSPLRRPPLLRQPKQQQPNKDNKDKKES